jgi:hypothetical protein
LTIAVVFDVRLNWLVEVGEVELILPLLVNIAFCPSVTIEDETVKLFELVTVPLAFKVPLPDMLNGPLLIRLPPIVIVPLVQFMDPELIIPPVLVSDALLPFIFIVPLLVMVFVYDQVALFKLRVPAFVKAGGLLNETATPDAKFTVVPPPTAMPAR